MRSLLSLAAVAASLAPSIGCAHLQSPETTVAGNGDVVSETRALTAFSSLHVSGGLEVVIRAGAPSVILEADSNLIPLLRTVVKDGHLELGIAERTRLRPSRPIRLTVSGGRLARLGASGGAKVGLEAATERALAVNLSGGVEFTALELQVDALEASASGGVALELAGHVDRASFRLAGGVDLRGKQLHVTAAEVKASGGCDLELSVAEAIAGSLSGGVGLRVCGRPRLRGLSTSGGSDVTFTD